jgi:hypothetical protein
MGHRLRDSTRFPLFDTMLEKQAATRQPPPLSGPSIEIQLQDGTEPIERRALAGQGTHNS